MCNTIKRLPWVGSSKTWANLGIKNPKLTLEEDLFSEQADKNDYGLKKLIEEKYRKDADPAIDIRPKK